MAVLGSNPVNADNPNDANGLSSPNIWNFLGGNQPTTTQTGYDPRDYTLDTRYQAWVAAGRPTKDRHGNDLAVGGEYASLGWDSNYTLAHQNQLGQDQVNWAKKNGYGANVLPNWLTNPKAQGNHNPFLPGSTYQSPYSWTGDGPGYTWPDAGPEGGRTGTHDNDEFPGGGFRPQATHTGYQPPGTTGTGSVSATGGTANRINPTTGGTITNPLSLGSNPLTAGSYSGGKPSGSLTGGFQTYTPGKQPMGFAAKSGFNTKVGGMPNSGNSGPIGNVNVPTPTTTADGITNYTVGPVEVKPDTPGQGGGGFYINGQRLDFHDPRIWGNSGSLIVGNWDDISNLSPESLARYYDVTYGEDENGARVVRSYNLKPQWEERLAGRVQVPQAGLGGYAGVIDPSRLQWDPEFGLVTTPDNLTAVDVGTYATRGHQVIQAIGTYLMGQGLYAGAGEAGWLGDAASGAGAHDASWWTGPEGAGTNFGGYTVPPVGGPPAGNPTGTPTNPPPGSGPPTTNTPPPTTNPSGNPLGNLGNTARDVYNYVSNIPANIMQGLPEWAQTAIRGARTIMQVNSVLNMFGAGYTPNGGGRNMPTGNNSLTNPLTAGLDLYNSNRRLQQYTDRDEELWNRADFMRFRRDPLIDQLLADPETFLNQPKYQNMRSRRLSQLEALKNREGGHLSGNELVELNELGQELDYKQINSERDNLRRNITLSNPSNMYGPGTLANAFAYQARGDRNQSVGNLINSVSSTAAEWLRRIINGLAKPEDVPEEVRGELSDADPDWDQHDAEWWSGYPDEGLPGGNTTDEDWWNWVLGGGAGSQEGE